MAAALGLLPLELRDEIYQNLLLPRSDGKIMAFCLDPQNCQLADESVRNSDDPIHLVKILGIIPQAFGYAGGLSQLYVLPENHTLLFELPKLGLMWTDRFHHDEICHFLLARQKVIFRAFESPQWEYCPLGKDTFGYLRHVQLDGEWMSSCNRKCLGPKVKAKKCFDKLISTLIDSIKHLATHCPSLERLDFDFAPECAKHFSRWRTVYWVQPEGWPRLRAINPALLLKLEDGFVELAGSCAGLQMLAEQQYKSEYAVQDNYTPRIVGELSLVDLSGAEKERKIREWVRRMIFRHTHLEAFDSVEVQDAPDFDLEFFRLAALPAEKDK